MERTRSEPIDFVGLNVAVTIGLGSFPYNEHFLVRHLSDMRSAWSIWLACQTKIHSDLNNVKMSRYFIFCKKFALKDSNFHIACVPCTKHCRICFWLCIYTHQNRWV